MTRTYDEVALRIRLDDLDPAHQAAFAAACAERQLENYQAFSTDVGSGDPTTLANALDRVWRVLAGQEPLDREEISRLAGRCESLAPASHEFRSYWTGWAQNAAASVTYTLQYMLSGDTQLVVWVARSAYNAMDSYVLNEHIVKELGLDINHPSVEEKIREHPLVQEELRHQDDDLSLLEGAATLDPSLLARLRARAQAGGLRPVARGIFAK